MPGNLPNHRRPRSSPDSVPQPVQRTQQATTLRGVGQDKPRPPRSRIASAQPAPIATWMFAHRLNRNSSRSQNRLTSYTTLQISLPKTR